MVIDFHTHIFPDAIAERALSSLITRMEAVSGISLPPDTNGTLSDLRRAMGEQGVDKSVVLPIATKPSQTAHINDFAAAVCSEDVLSFASLHPAQEDCEAILEQIAERGFVGIKLHPEFQDFFVDDPASLRILKKAESLGLYTVLHAGMDVGFRPPVRCTPERLSHALTEVSGRYIIAAHLGGCGFEEDTLRYLCGTPIYMDTAVVDRFIPKETALAIIRAHGAERILFGSDSPWSSPRAVLAFLSSLGLSEEEYESITYRNARRILGI